MSRRATTLVVSGVLAVVLLLFGAIAPVPYVALMPGDTTNTLGKKDGRSLITIKGHESYRAKGHLDLVTVGFSGTPKQPLNLVMAVRGWFDPHVAVVPQRTVFPEDESVKEVLEETSRQMRSSQQAATTAALCELDISVSSKVSVARVRQGLPAAGKLAKGDVITAVDGQRVTGCVTASSLVTEHQPGEPVTVTVERAGETVRQRLRTAAAPRDPERAVVGVVLETSYEYPFQVKITLKNVGGPSAGLMFALGIVDKLTPHSLTGGKFIAGTGTISAHGEIGPIGGIQQKLVAARQAGATIFLTPAANCATAKSAAPEGLRLVKVETLDGALRALDALRTGQGAVPRC